MRTVMKHYRIIMASVILASMPIQLMAGDAEQMEIERLKDNIGRLQDDMNSLQKQFYQRPVGSSQGMKGKPEIGAQFTDIEEKMRQLTGKVEELQFHVDALTRKQDGLTRDVYERLAGIENKLGQSPAGITAPISSAAPRVPAPETVTPKVEDANTQIVLEKGPEGMKVPSDANMPPAPADGSSDTLAPAEQYQQAFQLVKQSKYVEAEAALKTFIQENPKNPLTENAYYWLGETYYLRENYSQAAVQFMKGYQSYPKGNKTVDNLFKLALALDKMDKKKESCTTFQKLGAEFPNMNGDIKAKVEKEKKRINCG